MSVECFDGVLSLDYPKTWGGVVIGLDTLVSVNDVSLFVELPCGGDRQHIHVNLGEVVEVICSDPHPYYWTLEYLEYFSAYAARIRLCKELSEPEPEPEPEPTVWNELVGLILTPVTFLIDGVKDIIDVGLAGVTGLINGVDTSVSGLSSWMAFEMASLKDGLIGEITGVSNYIGTETLNLKVYLFNEIDDVKSAVNDLNIPSIEDINLGFTSLIDKIEKLEVPTVESIKEGFLSITTEFAESIWDKILDKIEERYNK